MFAILTLLALSPPAEAGELVVLVQDPVVIAVDGQAIPLTPGTSQARASGLAGGGHLVEIRNRANQSVAELTVQVGPSEEVRLRYARNAVTELGRGQLANCAVSPDGGAVTHIPGTTQTAGVSAMTPEGGVSLNMSVTETGTTMTVPGEGGFTMNVDLGSMAAGAPVAEVEAGPMPMAPGDFARLLRAVKDESFSDDQVDIIQTASRGNFFTCAQLAQLIEPISFGNDKVEAVQAARGAVVDPQNAHELEAAFTFSSDKEMVRKLFR